MKLERGDADAGLAPRDEPFVCPMCGEGAPVETECVRCGVTLRAVGARSVTFAAPTTLPELRSLRFPLFVCAMVVGAPGLLIAANHAPISLRATGTLTVGLSAVALFLLVLAALQPKPGRRGWLDGVRHRLRGLGRGATRIRGVARVEDGALFVVDGDTRVRVPVDRRGRVVGADASGAATVEEGQAIEVVGHAARLRVPSGYRDEVEEEVFDVERGVELRVAARRP